MKKLILLVMSISILIASTVFAVNFSDVSGHWAESFIIDLANKGVINGYTDGTYKPDKTLTYGEYFKLIVTATLPDADFSVLNNETGHWAGGYLTVLENYKIFEPGVITKEILDSKISRIEVVRVLGECDIKIRENDQKTIELEFNDISDINELQETTLRHAVAIGVINGDPNGKFRPNGELKRSEVAKIIATYTAN